MHGRTPGETGLIKAFPLQAIFCVVVPYVFISFIKHGYGSLLCSEVPRILEHATG